MTTVKREHLERSYNAIYSMGRKCLVAIQLHRLGLRKFGGMLDWNRSVHLSNVNLLLRNRFAGYMELDNLEFTGYDQGDRCLMLRDKVYDIYSVHDYPKDYNTPDHLVSYPEVKAMYDRRIQRFLEKTAVVPWLLFIRIEGTYEEVVELERQLRSYVKHQFHILLVLHGDHPGIIEIDWNLEHVCVVSLDTEQLNDEVWDELLARVAYEEYAG